MKSQNFFVWGAVVVICGLVISAAAVGFAGELNTNSPTRSSGASTITGTEERDWTLVEQKLDELISTQKEILELLDEAMEEARIAKIRASRRRGN